MNMSFLFFAIVNIINKNPFKTTNFKRAAFIFLCLYFLLLLRNQPFLHPS